MFALLVHKNVGRVPFGVYVRIFNINIFWHIRSHSLTIHRGWPGQLVVWGKIVYCKHCGEIPSCRDYDKTIWYRTHPKETAS